MSDKARIGLIGVGAMGHGIAANILKGGYPLTFLEHPGNRPTDDLIAAGARSSPTGAAVAAQSDIVILCVSDTTAVEDALFRPEGVRAGLKPGGIVIDCSTAIPASTRANAARIAEAGGRLLDAAMTRTPKEAEEGRLNLIVGGPGELLELVAPVLRCFAEQITHVGDLGSGHEVKLLHNFVSLGFTAVLAEAFAAARQAGIADAVFADVLAAGAGGGVVFDRLRRYLFMHDAESFRFSIANAAKDLTYYTAMTAASGASHVIADAVRATYAEATETGHASQPVPMMIDLLTQGR